MNEKHAAKPMRALQVVGGMNAGDIETFIMDVYRSLGRTPVIRKLIGFSMLNHREGVRNEREEPKALKYELRSPIAMNSRGRR